MKRIVVGAFCLVLFLSIFYIFKNDKEPILAESGVELLGRDSEVLLYRTDEGYEDYGFLTYTFIADSDIEWFLQGIIDTNRNNSFSYDEWLVRNEKPDIVKGDKVKIRFEVPEELKEADLSEVRVWLAATRREIGLVPDIFEQDGFVITASVLYGEETSY